MRVKASIHRAGVRLPKNRSFERELEALEALSRQPLDAAGVESIRKSLGHANNYLVAKAAKLVADNALSALLPDVLAAYDRFFIDAVRSDPQCWAKNALGKALVTLECRDPQVYLRGLRHIQEEPVWGGQSDTAGALRATCTHALVACDSVRADELLNYLLAPLVDSDKTVRIEAARAIGHVGGTSAALLLKLRVMLRKEESEVLGACFSAFLGMENIDKPAAIALVAEFLDDAEECAAEAAFALAETHDVQALADLLERRRKGADAWLSSILDSAIVLTRLSAGLDYLMDVIEKDERPALSALEAISRVYQTAEIRARVATAVATSKSDRVRASFKKLFPEEAAPAQ